MIAIIDYGSGNISSVRNALLRLDCESLVTNDPVAIMQADKVILPGVGQAESAMAQLREINMDRVIQNLRQPLLGICLGLQLLCQKTEEGKVDCLGIFDAEVKLFPPEERVPHIGWNNLEETKGPLFNQKSEAADVYFVHSYYATLCDQTVAKTAYILPFSAALQKDNFYATQFHPEKSAMVGASILKNFLEL